MERIYRLEEVTLYYMGYLEEPNEDLINDELINEIEVVL